MSSLPNMVLELQMAAQDGAPAAPLPGVGPSLPVPGSCSVKLWAPLGMHMAFRVSLGEGAGAVARRFEHTFRPDATVGSMDEANRVCFLMPNMGQLDQVWKRSVDVVQLNFELLEFRCQPVLVTSLPAPEALPAEAGQEGKQAEDGGDDMSYSRTAISEALMQERLRTELQGVRNRSVRRVEWRVEGCSRLLDMCRVGESVDSPPFSAAGLERIQFHFYPRGYEATNAPPHAQPCALYVSGPVRTTLRGTLWVGSNSRQFEHRFQRKGDAGGRDKFGPLEMQLDCNDAIMVALEVQEVETDLAEAGGTTLCLRDAVTRPQTGGAGKGGTLSAPLAGTKGTLRMRREDPSKTEELVKCVSLPTLNARHLHKPLLKASRRLGGTG